MVLEMIVSVQICKSRAKERAGGLDVRCEGKSTVKHNVYSRFFNKCFYLCIYLGKRAREHAREQGEEQRK